MDMVWWRRTGAAAGPLLVNPETVHMHRCLLAIVGTALMPAFPADAQANTSAPSDLWVLYEPEQDSDRHRRIVLISGDEEYRSEEALPQLAAILTVRHGFTCSVHFAVDDTGTINPDDRTNIPGLDQLDEADLMIIATRFRDLPDDQMAHIDAYLKAGKPVIGLRTATHAFNFTSSDTYATYSWDDPSGGFGRVVLGETWIAHHGRHGEQSTRGLIASGAGNHPITRGLADGDVWGPTDVYRVRLPLQDRFQPLILGQVLDAMTPDAKPVAGEQNVPMMPVAWAGTYELQPGHAGRVFTTTMGAATDLACEGTRRMIVNGVYWALGLEDQLPPTGAGVDIVGRYAPSSFGFGAFRPGVRPADHALPAAETDHD